MTTQLCGGLKALRVYETHYQGGQGRSNYPIGIMGLWRIGARISHWLGGSNGEVSIVRSMKSRNNPNNWQEFLKELTRRISFRTFKQDQRNTIWLMDTVNRIH